MTWKASLACAASMASTAKSSMKKIGAHVAAQDAVERAVQLGGVHLVEHLGRRYDDDALGGVASLEGDRRRLGQWDHR